MRILYIGDLNTYARSYHIYQALCDLPVEVVGLSFAPLGEIPGIGRQASLLRRVLIKLGYHLDVTGINQQIIDVVKKEKPFDVLFISQGLSLNVSTIRAVKQACPEIFVLYLTLDNMVIPRNRSRQLLGYLPLVDLYVSTPRENHAENLRKLGVKRFEVLPSSFNERHFTPRSDTTPFERDAVFIGTFEQYRYEMLCNLAMNGIDVTVFGNGWPHIEPTVANGNLHIENRPVFESELLHVLHTSRIALNFVRKANHDRVTARTIEIPASGTFMLAERTQEQQDYFLEGEEAEFFDTQEELARKAKFYLDHDKERTHIARAGRQRCESGQYSYRARLAKLLEIPINRNVVSPVNFKTKELRK